MKPFIKTLWTIKQPLNFVARMLIHSGLRMTSQELATALRPFIFTVHPDRFWNHPKEKNTNEISLKKLNEFFGDKNDGKANWVHRQETITFYLRNSSEHNKSTVFEKVNIKLDSRENISTTVHRILSQCSLPTDYLKKIGQESTTAKKNKSTINPQRNEQAEPKPYGRYENEFFYSKDLFEEMEAEYFKNKMETKFSEWLQDNYQLASNKLEASLPIRVDLEKLKQELIEKLDLVDLQWNCNWTVSHIRGALKNLNLLSKQHPEDMKRLRSKTVVFSRHSGVGFEGQVILSIEDVRVNWLYSIRSISKYDFYVRQIPIAEQQLSDLLGGISIVHPEYNIWNAKEYFNQLQRIIRSVGEYDHEHGFPSDWPDSLDEHRLIVEFDSGPLMLSPIGDFIIPAGCPVPLLIRFIMENREKASQMLDKKQSNLEHERKIREECSKTFNLGCLEKEVNITPEQMIDFCRRILDNRDKLENYLQKAHLQVPLSVIVFFASKSFQSTKLLKLEFYRKMADFLLSLVIFIGSVLFVILLILLGWYCVWKFFLCRFRLVRELLRLNEPTTTSNNANSGRLPRSTRTRPSKID